VERRQCGKAQKEGEKKKNSCTTKAGSVVNSKKKLLIKKNISKGSVTMGRHTTKGKGKNFSRAIVIRKSRGGIEEASTLVGFS